MKRKIYSAILALMLLTTVLPQTGFAAESDEQTMAVEYVTAHKIFVGDANGNLNLDSELTRAELAVILTRLDYLSTPGGLDEWNTWGQKHFADPENRYNTFTDMPDWAAPYIEYCYQRGLMVGVGENRFDPQGKVNPQMAATVILRYCGIRETDWSYQTSVTKAQSIGIAPGEGMDSTTVPRGTMAVIIYRGIHHSEAGNEPNDPAVPVTPPQTTELPIEASIEEMKAEIVRLTNIERVKAGVPELEVLPELMDCAQAKAQDFIDNNYFNHISPVYGTPTEMIKSFVPEAKSMGENNAAWTTGAESAIYGFLNSPSHYATMTDSKFTHIGVGIVGNAEDGYWWVQQFVRLD